MNRVLVTGGAGTIGAAVVRRLMDDERFAVRVSDQREPPAWMREGCEVHTGDLRVLDEARRATEGCSHVVHLAAIVGGIANFHKLPYTLTEVNAALYNGVVRAALDHAVERFTYVSSSMVFERATQYPTREEHIWDCPTPRSAYGFSKLTGEVYVRAAHDEHGLPYTICRPFNAYGPGEMPEDEPGIAHAVPDLIRKCLALAPGAPLPIFGDGTHTRTLTHIDDIAEGIVAATSSPAGLNEDFNISGERGAHGGRDRARHLGGHRPRPRRVRARARADVRGRRGPALAERREGRAGAGLARAHRRARGRRADRRLAAPAPGPACLSGGACGRSLSRDRPAPACVRAIRAGSLGDMTALTLPRNLPGRRRRSKPASLVKGVAKTWTSMKLGSAAARSAKKGAKAYGSWKVTKFVGKRAGKLLIVPLALGGGFAAWRTMRSSGDDGPPLYGSSAGPAASPQTVTPPKTAPGSANGETGVDTPVPPGATA